MAKWFQKIAAKFHLPEEPARQLRDVGYVFIKGPVDHDELARLSDAYDAAVLAADPADVSVSTSTRVQDFVNRGRDFDELYIYGPLLAACCDVIGRPFKLSTMRSRTLEPGAPMEELHADFKRYDEVWPMVGFILMLDDFRDNNGATRFVPGSHLSGLSPSDVMTDTTADCDGQMLACGPAGSMIIYNGSIWHGWTANRSSGRRRSIQGAFIRRDVESWYDQNPRMRPETLGRIGALAKYLLNLETDENMEQPVLLEERPYTREELLLERLDKPLRGLLCPRCSSRIPQFADLKDSDLARIRQLILDGNKIQAISLLRDATGCSLSWGKLWVNHCGKPEWDWRPTPRCPFCGGLLRTPTAKQCRHCLRDWHDQVEEHG